MTVYEAGSAARRARRQHDARRRRASTASTTRSPPTDRRVLDLAEELGPEACAGARSASASTTTAGSPRCRRPAQLLTFPGLSYADRARLVRVRAALPRDRRSRRSSTASRSRRGPAARAATACGSGCGARCSTPSSTASYDDLPATYLWSRMRRTAGTRDRKGHEVMGWIEGGYQAMVDRLADAHPRARRRSPDVDAGAVRAVLEPPRDRRRARRRLPPARHGRGDAAAPEPAAHARPRARTRARARPPALHGHRLPGRARQAQRQPVLRPQHHRSPRSRSRASSRRRTWSIRRPPAGRSIYLPKYVNPDSPELEKSSADIIERVPRPREDDVPGVPGGGRDRRAGRARPRRRAGVPGRARRKPDPFAAPGLVVASSAQVYPDIVHGQAILGVAERVAGARMPACPSQSAAWKRHDHEQQQGGAQHEHCPRRSG